jgi:formate hydrogenlyase subunit 6/NADH:ubiquinone oxidoreductase subunit I
MLKNIVRNLITGPPTRRYPFEKRPTFPGTRGKVVFDLEKCNFCGACARICPAEALVVNKEKKEIIYYPFRCIYCGNCVDSCPRDGVSLDIYYVPPGYEKTEELIRAPQQASKTTED